MATELIGRAEELAFLDAAHVGADLSGVVIAGEAGVGKTRLAREFLARLAAGAQPSDWVAATESLASIPFGVFAHLVPPAAADPLSVFRAVRDELMARTPGSRAIVGVDDAFGCDATVRHQCAVEGRARGARRAPDAVGR